MGWFDGGDKHTGWKDAKTGKPLTDKEAKRLSDSITINGAKKRK